MTMPVRVALVGCGKIAERLALPQLIRCAQTHVAALVDDDRTAALRLAKKFGIDTRLIWTDWKKMLRQAEVDAVAVCVPNHLHRDIVVASCEAKKHVMVEKPIALTLQEADEMIEAARKASVRLMVEQTQRFDPIHETAQALLERRPLGKVTAVRGRLGHAGPEYWSAASPWLTTKRLSGGGALIDVGIHIVDLLRWLSGKTVARVCAIAKTLQKPVRVEDAVSALLEFTDGAIGSFEASWTTRPYEVKTWFYGERGTLTTAYGAPHAVSMCLADVPANPNAAREVVTPRIPAQSRLGGAYPYFADCILTHRRPFLSGEEGRASLEVVLAAYCSIEEGGWITLPLEGRRGNVLKRQGRRSPT